MQGIYQIRNMQNNKIYIGSSLDIEQRWKSHEYNLNRNKHHSFKLQEDWNKFGEECFVLEVLEECEDASRDEIFILEQKYIDDHKAYIDGYNVAKSSTPLKKIKVNSNQEYSGEFQVEKTILKIGNSLGVILPNDFLKKIKLSYGNVVYVSCKNGRIIIDTTTREDTENIFDEESLLYLKNYLENFFEPRK